MNLNKISTAVRAALAKPGTFATERGVEVEQRGGYKEILVSFKGLKTILEQEGQEQSEEGTQTNPENQEPESQNTEVADDSQGGEEKKVEEPAANQEPPAEQPVAAPAPAAPVKGKPGPKPKTPAAA